MATHATSSAFHLGPKGRIVLPVAVRRAARIPDGAEVVARADGEGRIVVETIDAIRKRVWDGAPVPTGLDATADVRAMREEDTQIADAAAAARSQAGQSEGPTVGAALLSDLGL